MTQENPQSSSAAVLEEFRTYLAGVTISPAVHYHNLTVFPLVASNGHEPLYTLLQPAIEKGEAEVKEVSESGSVPNILLINRGDKPILLPEGEILIGAKQNRVTNVTILAAAHSETQIPVSCVERGRWGYTSRHFHPEFFATPILRSKKSSSVHRSYRTTGQFRSDQGEVWREVDCCLRATQADSPTDSLTDSYQAAQERLEHYRKHFRLPENATGLIVAQGARVLALDLFDCTGTFQQLQKRICDSYFLDALRVPLEQAETEPAVAARFIQSIQTHASVIPKGIGLGTTLRWESEETVGSALWFQGRICHLSAFAPFEN